MHARHFAALTRALATATPLPAVLVAIVVSYGDRDEAFAGRSLLFHGSSRSEPLQLRITAAWRPTVRHYICDVRNCKNWFGLWFLVTPEVNWAVYTSEGRVTNWLGLCPMHEHILQDAYDIDVGSLEYCLLPTLGPN